MDKKLWNFVLRKENLKFIIKKKIFNFFIYIEYYILVFYI